MRAWLLDSLNGIANLRLGKVPDPSPGPGEALLDLDYAALNPADRYLAEGQYPARPTFPHILGRDGLGTVVAVGPGVTSPKVGDRVLILRGDTGVNRPGSFAERVVVAADSLHSVPTGWGDAEAAGAALAYMTAYQALTMWDPIPQPSVVLITGASGGVGVASLQLARAAGHTVVALSRDPAKRAHLEQLGAAASFDPHDERWRRQVKEFLGERRVDLAIDNIGGPLFNEVIEVMGEHGRVSCVGRLAGPVPQFNTASLFFRRLRIGGVAVGAYTRAQSQAAFDQVVAILTKSGAKPLVDHVFPFEQLPAAFDRLAKGPMGKVLLAIKSRG